MSLNKSMQVMNTLVNYIFPGGIIDLSMIYIYNAICNNMIYWRWSWNEHVSQYTWFCRSCELCGRSGFLNDEFLIRHCILRCSQRNNLQVSFAVIVSNYAKVMYKQVISFTMIYQLSKSAIVSCNSRQYMFPRS